MEKYHILFGTHSGIPPCCIRFFVQEWDMSEGWRDEGNWYHQAINAAKFGYVPCPDCLGSGNKAKIIDCSIGCGGDHQEDFYAD